MGLRLDVSAPPFKMDLLVEKGGKDPRPTSFTTSAKTQK